MAAGGRPWTASDGSKPGRPCRTLPASYSQAETTTTSSFMPGTSRAWCSASPPTGTGTAQLAASAGACRPGSRVDASLTVRRRPQAPPPYRRPCRADQAALGVLAALAVVIVLTFRDYGITWD